MVGLVVLLLVVAAAVDYYFALLAGDVAHFATLEDRAYHEVFADFVFPADFVRDETSLVHSVGVRTPLQENHRYFVGTSHSAVMQDGVSLNICLVDARTIIQQQLNNVVLSVVPSCLQKWSFLHLITLIHISPRNNQTLTNLEILLHTSQSQRRLPVISFHPRVCPKHQQHFD